MMTMTTTKNAAAFRVVERERKWKMNINYSHGDDKMNFNVSTLDICVFPFHSSGFSSRVSFFLAWLFSVLSFRLSAVSFLTREWRKKSSHRVIFSIFYSITRRLIEKLFIFSSFFLIRARALLTRSFLVWAICGERSVVCLFIASSVYEMKNETSSARISCDSSTLSTEVIPLPMLGKKEEHNPDSIIRRWRRLEREWSTLRTDNFMQKRAELSKNQFNMFWKTFLVRCLLLAQFSLRCGVCVCMFFPLEINFFLSRSAEIIKLVLKFFLLFFGVLLLARQSRATLHSSRWQTGHSWGLSNGYKVGTQREREMELKRGRNGKKKRNRQTKIFQHFSLPACSSCFVHNKWTSAVWKFSVYSASPYAHFLCV